MIIQHSTETETPAIKASLPLRALTALSGIVMMFAAMTMTVVALILAILISPVLMLWGWVLRRGIASQKAEHDTTEVNANNAMSERTTHA